MRRLILTTILALNGGLGQPPSEIDRSTPLATVHGFLNAAHDAKYPLAAHYLDLDAIPAAQQAAEGQRLARRLRFVIDRKLFVDFAKLSHEPSQGPGTPSHEDIGALPLGHTNRPIRLTRVMINGAPVWVFGSETVRSIDALYDAYGPPLGDVLPDFFYRHALFDLELWQWCGLAVLVFAAWGLSRLLDGAWRGTARRVGRATGRIWLPSLGDAIRQPLRLFLWTLTFLAGISALLLDPDVLEMLRIGGRILAIASFAWLLLRSLDVLAVALDEHVQASRQVHVRSRGVRTQIGVLRRVIAVVIYLVGFAFILMQFQTVRHVGMSLLASAGIASVVLGLAAQKSISALLAGLQLSISQPIRIGDTVLVESESGVIEEITLTYVVIKLWDLRRLVVPMTYFLEKPFQNWSRGSQDTLANAMAPARAPEERPPPAEPSPTHPV